jgi:acyloxyacyl hydrolase
LVKLFGPLIIKALEAHNNPDVVCHAIGACTNKQCKIMPAPAEGLEMAVSNVRAVLNADPAATAANIQIQEMTTIPTATNTQAGADPLPPICKELEKIPPLFKLCQDIFGFANNHMPIEDDDGDGYSSTTATLRGTDWRGVDCNAKDAAVHPGALPIDGDKTTDSNCNGISGVRCSGFGKS